MTHYEPPHQDLHCLQIQLFSSLAAVVVSGMKFDCIKYTFLKATVVSRFEFVIVVMMVFHESDETLTETGVSLTKEKTVSLAVHLHSLQI